MKIKVYKLYLLKKFLKKILLISVIFFSLILILNLIEEINYLKNSNNQIYLPIMLTLLNTPILVFDALPFIFLISTQFFFIDIIENKEFYTFKNFGLSNFDLIKFLTLSAFLLSIIIVIFFYNFSSILKNQYLLIKNNYSNDNKYLAVITENGLWIRDILQDKITIINADKISGNLLLRASVTEFDTNFRIQRNIVAEKINIRNKEWILHNVIITDKNNNSTSLIESYFFSNFELNRINSLFSNLNSLTYFKLQKLRSDYKVIGYSTDDIDIQIHKIYKFPFLLSLMTIISCILMMNIKYQKNLMLHLFIGVFLSVIIYYISHFSNLLGSNNKMPIIFSVWFPVLILSIASLIGVVRINEK
jgi:lipopolysaccharide export system permease protein